MKHSISRVSVVFLLLVFSCLVDAKKSDMPRLSQTAFETTFKADQSINGAIENRMAFHHVPGMSIAVIHNGEILWSKGYGLIQSGNEAEVNAHTMFSVGSVSKLVTAVTTLRLVDAGKLDLDEDINQFLKQWKVKDNVFTSNKKVTLRHILSHTSGFNVHGFKDFLPGEHLPTVIDVLNGNHPAKNVPVTVGFIPGTQYRYSGGGTMVEQLIIEDNTAKNMQQVAKEQVFEPLAMYRSTFTNPVPEVFGNIAKAHDSNGKPVALPRGWESMPEAAASGLWTTAHDLATLVTALIEDHQTGSHRILSHQLVKDMMTPVNPSQYGLGPRIRSHDLFGHNGANDSYRAFVVGNLRTGNGVVVLTNGSNGDVLGAEVVRTFIKIDN